MIDLGLARIGRLLQNTPQTWKAIHVAGTNGKGSICAYVSALLHASGASYGRFTSPHLIDRWDCIDVNGQPVSEALFRDVETLVQARDREERVGATEFELLTATAFEVFRREKVEYGVVEVGLGGRLDATNWLPHKAVTVIAKIGLDHQSFLGDTLEEIALQKAGILRPGVPCVVDPSNDPRVLRVVEAQAHAVGAELHYPPATDELGEALAGRGYEPHQLQNLACAHRAYELARPKEALSLAQRIRALQDVTWPGRLQTIEIGGIAGCPRQQKALLDGAHNAQSAEVLASYVQKHLRSRGEPVTWVLAASEGKDMEAILRLLLRPGDTVAAVRFGPVDGMPWVRAAEPASLLRIASRCGVEEARQRDGSGNLVDALAWASRAAGKGPLVIAGSLYLVSDVLRLLRAKESSEKTAS